MIEFYDRIQQCLGQETEKMSFLITQSSEASAKMLVEAIQNPLLTGSRMELITNVKED